MRLILFESIEKSRLTKTGEEIYFFALDCAATENLLQGTAAYVLSGEGKLCPAPRCGLSGRALCPTIVISIERRMLRR